MVASLRASSTSSWMERHQVCVPHTLASAERGPAVSGPTPCAICLLDRHAAQALSVTGNGDVTVADAGVMVSSDHSEAAVLASSGDLILIPSTVYL